MQFPDSGACTSQFPACHCGLDAIDCHPGDINIRGESTFRLQISNIIPPNTLVVGRLRFDFIHPIRPLPNVTCTSVECGEALYYDIIDDEPTPTQLYRYQLTGVAGMTQLTIRDDQVATCTFNSINKPCAYNRRCSVSGSLSTCTQLWRGDGLPYATIAPTIGSVCSDGTRKRFHLRADFVEPFIQDLDNGELQESTYFTFDPDTNCSVQRTSEYYVYQAEAGSYLYVELISPGPIRQVWLTPNHISYHEMGEPAEHHGCVTRNSANETSCYFVYACNYAAGDYYFQVKGGDHKIRVTEKDFLIKNIAVGQSANLTLPEDYTQVIVFHVNPVAGQNMNPLNNLEAYFSTGVPLDSWMTRHAFGDIRCSYSRFLGATDQVHKVIMFAQSNTVLIDSVSGEVRDIDESSSSTFAIDGVLGQTEAS